MLFQLYDFKISRSSSTFDDPFFRKLYFDSSSNLFLTNFPADIFKSNGE